MTDNTSPDMLIITSHDDKTAYTGVSFYGEPGLHDMELVSSIQPDGTLQLRVAPAPDEQGTPVPASQVTNLLIPGDQQAGLLEALTNVGSADDAPTSLVYTVPDEDELERGPIESTVTINHSNNTATLNGLLPSFGADVHGAYTVPIPALVSHLNELGEMTSQAN